ncbi:AP-1 complex-associated regulatory protein-like isoform X2 [Dreissena polymorpha]|uniref:AP-1 complex-associated regulatory protein-like isoform X2 n=1 Tax=Dreissena polymorpha TaxID=45954 RepID=UPI002263D6A2|nr:AP-1 complex-associated regulatory protein-like isoform X2 [Dreissena polymorpha]
MGNCLRKCFGRFDKRRNFLHLRYSVEKDASVEEEVQDEMSKLVTEREKQLLSNRQYNTLIKEQKLHDAEIDRQLHEEEERIRKEEEAYISARREAARVARLQQEREDASGPSSWKAGQHGQWQVAGGEDDFEMFLEGVRQRSIKAQADLRKSLSPGAGSSSSQEQGTMGVARGRSNTDQSMELEWDHDEDTGLIPDGDWKLPAYEGPGGEERGAPEGTEGGSSPRGSVELEWDIDSDFTELSDKVTPGTKANVAQASEQ